MARQHFGLRLHGLRKLRFQGRGDAAMQLLAPAAQQRAISSILHQSVLERVFGIWRRPASENHLGTHQLLQSIVQLLVRYLRGSTDQLM
jgi:hypothetical protein